MDTQQDFPRAPKRACGTLTPHAPHHYAYIFACPGVAGELDHGERDAMARDGTPLPKDTP